MNNNIILNVDGNTGKVTTNCTKIGNQAENLQKKIIFKMTPKIDGVAWMEYEIDGTKYFTHLDSNEEGYEIDIKSALLTSTSVTIDLKITETENAAGIPVFVSDRKTFAVNETIQATEEEPEQYPTWLDTANEVLASMENINISADKVGTVTTISITNSDGQTTTTQVMDGAQGEQGEPGEKGDPGDLAGVKVNGVTQTNTGGYAILNNIEKDTNKTTTINSSSTDAQYPSAKAVYTLFNSLENLNDVNF